MQVNLDLGPKLFSFATFTDWCNHAKGAWKAAGVTSQETLCIDQKGRVCGWGKHFVTARAEDAFPVDVYLMRTDLQQNVEMTGRQQDAAEPPPAVVDPSRLPC